jgi:hypothetical protein
VKEAVLACEGLDFDGFDKRSQDDWTSEEEDIRATFEPYLAHAAKAAKLDPTWNGLYETAAEQAAIWVQIHPGTEAQDVGNKVAKFGENFQSIDDDCFKARA